MIIKAPLLETSWFKITTHAEKTTPKSKGKTENISTRETYSLNHPISKANSTLTPTLTPTLTIP